MIDFGKPIAPALVTSGWGEPRPHRNGVHEGLDFHADPGTPVRAVEDGVVAYIQATDEGTVAHGGAGKYLVVTHADGWSSRYLHLSDILVGNGDQVSKGEVIAMSGASGIAVSAPHLHFDLKLQELDQYTSRFGKPTTGFGARSTFGVGVPAEPVIPVDSYADKVIAGAKERGVPLYLGGVGGGSMNWINVAALLALGWLGWKMMRD